MRTNAHECTSLQGAKLSHQQYVDFQTQESSCARVCYRVISMLLASAMTYVFMMIFLRVPGGAWLSLFLASLCLCCVLVCSVIIILLRYPESPSLGRASSHGQEIPSKF